MIIFLKFLVISQSSTAENRTLCDFRLSRFPQCTWADGIALGLSVGDTVSVITSHLRESRPPSVCHSFKVCFMGDHGRDSSHLVWVNDVTQFVSPEELRCDDVMPTQCGENLVHKFRYWCF